MQAGARQRAVAVTAGISAGSVVGLGLWLLVPNQTLVAMTALIWVISVCLFALGYQRIDDRAFDAAPDQPWWTVTTRRGWVGMIAAVTLGLAVFYALVAWLLSLPVGMTIWFLTFGSAVGPMMGGIGVLLGAEGESPLVAARKEQSQ